MLRDNEGFLRPAIDHTSCTGCGRCGIVCPVLSPVNTAFRRIEMPKTYACWTNDESTRLKSSSGGLFSEIASGILQDGGIVFGAAFDGCIYLRHSSVETVVDLDSLRRSKYVQSEIGETLKQVKRCLEQNRKVFFVGAPCQVAGLNAYLGKDEDNLITADFICHGVPSPGVFGEYVKYLENVYKHKMEDINFRDKRRGWPNSAFAVADFETIGEKVLFGRMNGFRYGFCNDYFLRSSCYRCVFKKMPRQADFTIADFAGIQGKYPNQAHKGISCLLLNSLKAEKCFGSLKQYISFSEEPFSMACEGNSNLYRSVSLPDTRKEFFSDFASLPFAVIMRKYLTPPFAVRVRALLKGFFGLRTVLLIQRTRAFAGLKAKRS
jgi:hypothetical protein